MHAQTYRREIDGLRAVAVLGVLLNHINPRVLPGGFVGVDVFFVISGFLITSIVARDLDHGRFSFSHFYSRRARRLIPAATVVAATSLALGYLLFLPKDFKDLGASVVAYTAMCSNFLFWRWGDYFAGQHKIWPLLHTWSLGVEEQFYLAYPFILWAISGWARSKRLLLLATLLAASFAISVYQTKHDVRSAYFLLPSRAWELLAGAICAVVPIQNFGAGWLRFGMPFLAAAGVFLPMALYGEKTAFPGLAAITPVLATVAVIRHTAVHDGWLKRGLSLGFLVEVGRMSYSLYLWHWPLLMFAKYPWSAKPETYPAAIPYVVGAVSMGIAWISYRYVETPGRTVNLPDRGVLFTAAAASVVIAAAGLAVHAKRGAPSRLPEAAVRFAAGEHDMNPDQVRTACLPNREIRSGSLERIGAESPGQKPTFVLFGDSHADALVPLFDKVAKAYGETGIALCRCGSFPLPNSGIINRTMDHEFPEAAVERLEREKIPCVVIAAFWAAHLEAEYGQGGQKLTSAQEKIDLMKRTLAATVQRLLTAGTRHVWLVRQAPAQPFYVPRQLAFDVIRGKPPLRGLSRAQQDAALAGADEVLNACVGENVSIIDVAGAIQDVIGDDLLTDDGSPAFCDDDHLSVKGSLAVRGSLDPLFEWLRFYEQTTAPIDQASPPL